MSWSPLESVVSPTLTDPELGLRGRFPLVGGRHSKGLCHVNIPYQSQGGVGHATFAAACVVCVLNVVLDRLRRGECPLVKVDSNIPKQQVEGKMRGTA